MSSCRMRTRSVGSRYGRAWMFMIPLDKMLKRIYVAHHKPHIFACEDYSSWRQYRTGTDGGEFVRLV
jgi:hypothetical protein